MTRTRTAPRWGRLAFGMLVLAAILAAPAARAQTPNINLMPELKSKTQEEKDQDAITEKAYRDSLHKIPNAKVSNDPWGDARAVESKPKESAERRLWRHRGDARAVESKPKGAKPVAAKPAATRPGISETRNKSAGAGQ